MKENSRPTGGGETTESKTPCSLLALGSCKLGDSCNDLHEKPEKGKIKPGGTGNGKGKSKAPSAVAISVCVSGREETGQLFGVALVASDSFDTDDFPSGRMEDPGSWTLDASTTSHSVLLSQLVRLN